MNIWSIFVGILLSLSQPLEAARIMTVSFNSVEMSVIKETLAKDLSKHSFVDFPLSKDSEFESFLTAVRKSRPDFIALLDNKAIKFMKMLQQSHDPELKKIQASATMALNLRKAIQGNENICGIVYEVPAYTIVTKFRNVMARPILTVLAPYRPSEFALTIEEARVQLQKEGIELIPVNVEANGKGTKEINQIVEQSLGETFGNKKIDAILVPSDNAILNPDAFFPLWITKARSLKVPFLCNLEKFASSDFDFCTFAAFPDLTALAHQYAEQISEILENGAQAADLGVDYIIGSEQLLNMKRSSILSLPILQNKLEGVRRIE